MSTVGMTVSQSGAKNVKRGALIALALLFIAMALTKYAPMMASEFHFELFLLALWGPMVMTLGVVIWMMFFSATPWSHRIAGLIALLAIMVATYVASHPSMQSMFFMFFAIPFGMMAFTFVLLVLSAARVSWRIGGAVVVSALVFGYFASVRHSGVDGKFDLHQAWRWEPSAEETYVAKQPVGDAATKAAIEKANALPLGEVTWSQFRGPNRDSVVPGLVLSDDWKTHVPNEVWHRDVGPAWSSFAVAGSRLFTQEQRGETEYVVCWDADTGNQLWENKISEERYWDAIAGAGPRATPTLAEGKLYTLGGKGTLQCLDPVTGKTLWSQSLPKAEQRETPMWGFSASPLVIGDAVVVHGGGKKEKKPANAEDKAKEPPAADAEKVAKKPEQADKVAAAAGEKEGVVLAYDRNTGKPLWSVPSGDHSYSSPQLANLLGHQEILMLTNQGLDAIDPETGKLVANYDWKSKMNYRVVQPLLVGNSIVVGTGMDQGTRLVEVTDSGDPKQPLKFSDTWTAPKFRPAFNDFVQHKGYLYGFDNNLLTCVNLKDGATMWTKRGYGNGQLLLLPDADQLLVVSEKGELALMPAATESPKELAKLTVLDGKTWNHPVLIGKRLYVRNDQHAAAFDLPLAEK